MAIIILPPTPAITADSAGSSSESEDGGVDLEGDTDMRPRKRARHHRSSHLVTPGEIVTEDPQWMR
jgi:exosome complex component RRP4